MYGLYIISLLWASCAAHTLMTNITIGGVTRSNCLRPAYPGNLWSLTRVGASDPIMQETPAGQWRGGVASTNYTCGFMPFAGNAAAAKCPVAAGSSVTVSYWHGAGYGDETPAYDQWIARSHKGPFMAFMAKYEAAEGLPTGNSWFKIYQSGKIAEATNGDWQTVKYASPDGLNANHGGMTFTIPSDLAPGNYLLRTEIIALHSAGALYGAQPYVRCAELTVSGAGTANPPGVAIPGNWTASHAGLNYKLWSDYTKPYPFPGPAVYTPTATSTKAQTSSSSTRMTTATSTSRVTPSTSTSKVTSSTSTSRVAPSTSTSRVTPSTSTSAASTRATTTPTSQVTTSRSPASTSTSSSQVTLAPSSSNFQEGTEEVSGATVIIASGIFFVALSLL